MFPCVAVGDDGCVQMLQVVVEAQSVLMFRAQLRKSLETADGSKSFNDCVTVVVNVFFPY